MFILFDAEAFFEIESLCESVTLKLAFGAASMETDKSLMLLRQFACEAFNSLVSLPRHDPVYKLSGGNKLSQLLASPSKVARSSVFSVLSFAFWPVFSVKSA